MNADDILNEVLKEGRGSKKAKAQTQYVLPGKGRKECPACNAFVGVRTLTCVCGHEFVIGESTVKTPNDIYDEPLTDEDKRYIRAIGAGKGGRIVYAGAGPVPADLKQCDEQSVRDFCEDIVSAGLKEGKLYMPRAIKNFVRHVIGERAITNKFTDEFIDKWYDDKVASTMGLEV